MPSHNTLSRPNQLSFPFYNACSGDALQAFVHFSFSTADLENKLKRVLESLLELPHPLSTDSAVDDLVVEAGGQPDLLIPLNTGGAILVLDGDSDLLGGSDSQDGGLGWVDDGGELVNSGVHAHVGDGDGATLVLLGLELVIASLLGQLLDGVGDGLEATGLGASDDGGDEASGGGDGDGNVDGLELADGIASPAGIDGGNLLAGNGDGLDEEVVDRKLVLALGGAVQGLTQLQQLVDGDRAGDEEVRVGLGRLQQAGGNGLAHAAEGDVLVGGAGGSNGRAADQLLDVLLGDLATLAGTLDTVEADAVLASQALGGGGSVGLTVESGLELALGRGSLLGLGGGSRGGSGSRRLGLLLLLRGGSGGVAAGVLERELLKGGKIGTLLNKDGDGLEE